MALAVEFDNDTGGMANEVDDISAHRGLPSEKQVVEMMCLDIAPQQRLRARHRPAKRFRRVAVPPTDCGVRHVRPPLSLTLPRKGGGNTPSLLQRIALAHPSLHHHPLNPPAK